MVVRPVRSAGGTVGHAGQTVEASGIGGHNNPAASNRCGSDDKVMRAAALPGESGVRE
ncbi:MAG: hypothetical protein QOI20_2663 [Acidimicrobiaceae bacterium]|nr:hypothetical protein [Acidimicrobiaceae bacterium]